MAQCEKHSCKNTLGDEQHMCSLCKSVAYCSDECRVSDWILHGCANQYTIESNVNPTGLGHMVPYAYEDVDMDMAELAKLPIGDPVFQAYSVKQTLSNLSERHFVVEPLLQHVGAEAISHCDHTMTRGQDGSKLLRTPYQLDVYITDQHTQQHTTDVVQDDDITKGMIYAENKANTKAQQLAGKGLKNFLKGGAIRAANQDKSVYVLWPRNQAKQLADRTVPLKGTIRVDLSVGGQPVSYLLAAYDLDTKRQGTMHSLGRTIKAKLRRQLQIKFAGTPRVVENMEVCRYQDHVGNSIVATFEIQQRTTIARLVDLEFIIPVAALNKTLLILHDEPEPRIKPKSVMTTKTPPPPPPADEDAMITSIACDPRNYEQVEALSMAMDLFLANANAADTTQWEEVASTIRNYSYTLAAQSAAGSGTAIPQDVRVAINAGMKVVYEHTNGILSPNWVNKVATSSYKKLKPEVEPLTKALIALRGDKTRRNAFKKKLLRKNLETIMREINKRITSLDTQGSAAEIANWRSLIDLINAALRGE